MGRCVLRENPPAITAGTLPVRGCVFRETAIKSGNLAYVDRIFSIFDGVLFLLLQYLSGVFLAYDFLRIPPFAASSRPIGLI